MSALTVALIIGLPSPTYAQTVRGRALDVQTEAPLTGVLISLLDESGERVRQPWHVRVECGAGVGACVRRVSCQRQRSGGEL